MNAKTETNEIHAYKSQLFFSIDCRDEKNLFCKTDINALAVFVHSLIGFHTWFSEHI